MGRTNPSYGIYGCMLDGDTTWHTARSELNIYQVRELQAEVAYGRLTVPF